MNKFGLLFKDLGARQDIFEAITSANKLLTTRRDMDVIAFYGNNTPPCLTPHFGRAMMITAFGFNGTLISTTIDCGLKMIEMPSAKRKIYLPYSLDWYGAHRVDYQSCLKVYRNKCIEVWARCPDHAWAIENCFNIKVKGIVEHFDLSKLC